MRWVVSSAIFPNDVKRSFTHLLFESRRLKKNGIVVTRVTPEDPQNYAGDVFFTEGRETQLAEQPAGISNEKSHLLMSSLDFRGMRLCDGGGTLSANAHAARQNKSRSVWLKHIEEGLKKALQDQLNTSFSNLTLMCCEEEEEEEEEEASSAARRLPPPPSCEKINPPPLSRRRSFRFCLQTTLMFLRHEWSHSWWSPNWCCTGNIFNSAALPAIKMSQEEKKTWADQRERQRGNEIQSERRHI